ncbi:transporter [Oenococcus oeni]|uniref:AEC family transporter n=1 Tax=Oenococcus oeni TaxID=1247 RepID=UPI0008F85DB2|nr:AEC family transporter [Oenococcus oeni]OIK98820.1 transporter [Oenococcus oeni]PDH76455.1 transporter [Oenococcus oeni]PDH87211.1 transporter [Oenococcus oeni]PDH88631.1 transporter [Oenococcus oeni]PDH90669.1 transporter [Oenococcus oeni]
MFSLILVGLLINKIGFFHQQTSDDLTSILLYVVSPCLIINAFEEPYSPKRIQQFLLTLFGIILFYLVDVDIFIARIVFGKIKDTALSRVVQYGSVYSNAGFMGVPLASSLFGSQGVFFAAASLAAFNIFNWTHGVKLFQPKQNQLDHKAALQKVVLNPNIIAIVCGLLLFSLSIKIPFVINQAVKYVGSVNTPLSMIVIGNSLAGIKFSRKILNSKILLALVMKNLFFPVIAIMILEFLKISGIAFYTTVVMAACPVAGIVVLFTLQARGNPRQAITLMSISTILSLATIPLVFAISKI